MINHKKYSDTVKKLIYIEGYEDGYHDAIEDSKKVIQNAKM